MAFVKNLTFIGVGLLGAFVHELGAAEASFQLLTTPDGQPSYDFQTPNAVSADGSVVVGQMGLQEAFRWTAADGIVGLGYIADFDGFQESSANGISGDGKIIAGYSSSSNASTEAFRWTASGGMTSLRDPASDNFFYEANGVSGDGSAIVGVEIVAGHNPAIIEAFRWTQGRGSVGLGQLSGGMYGSVALAASYDGSAIVGYSDSADSGGYPQAFRWTDKTGIQRLGDLPGGPTGSLGRAVSANGSVVVGESWTEGAWYAYRWTQKAGMIQLGRLYASEHDVDVNIAKAVSADGTRIVGTADFYDDTISDYRSVAFIWDAEHGMRDLNTVLQDEYGLDLRGLVLAEATAISADGSTIVGTTEGNYGWYAWVAHIPTPLDELIERVQSLSIADQQNAELLANLRNAQQFGVTGQCRKELKELSFFVRKISLSANKGVIDQAAAAALTATVNSVTSQLECD